MRRTPKVAAVVFAGMVALASCGGSAVRTGTSAPRSNNPKVTTPSTKPAPSTTAPATLTATEQTDLGFVHEQERVGENVLAVFAARYPSLPVFANLADSQKTQLATVTAMMAHYHLADPSTGQAAGTYTDQTLQQLYDSTIAAGTDADHALDAVEHFEQHNLASLQTARSHTTRTDLTAMYTNLEEASNSHITACNDTHHNLDMHHEDSTETHD